jgi:GGDEF domain-containing protein
VAPLRVASPPPGPVGVRPSPSEARPRSGAGTGEPHREGSDVPGLVDTPGAGGAAVDVAGGGRFEEGRAGDREETERRGAAGGEESGRDALWVGALRDEIMRAGRARMPLSLLLVELEDAERLLAAEPYAQASATFGRFAQVVRGAVRRRDVLACETESRAWIIARDTGRAGAQALGSRIAMSVPDEESWRGAPLMVSVGVAVLGEDGHNAASLIDAAEQTRFAAEASGIGILGGEPEDAGAEPEDAGAEPEDAGAEPEDAGAEPLPPDNGPGLAG